MQKDYPPKRVTLFYCHILVGRAIRTSDQRIKSLPAKPFPAQSSNVSVLKQLKITNQYSVICETGKNMMTVRVCTFLIWLIPAGDWRKTTRFADFENRRR